MRYVKTVVAAGAVALLSGAASAADMPLPPPYMPPPVQEFGGWYLRGDIGMTNQRVRTLHQAYEDVVPERFDYVSKGFDSSPLWGLGVGYRVNNWLRFDVTGEYRGRANMHVTAIGSAGSVDRYTGSKSEITGLANAYIDLGTWWGITPFVGAGVGASYNMIHDFYDICAAGGCAGQVTALADGTGSKWSFAWAAHAGLAYQVSPGLTLEFAYRYLDLGSAKSGWFHNIDPSASVAPGPYQFKDLTSHDLKFGVRWAIDPAPTYYHPPLITKG